MDEQHKILKLALKETEKMDNIKLSVFVKDSILKGLQKDENLKMMLCDKLPPGCYEDNLKVLSNDFAFSIPLQLPHNDQVRISADPENRGNVLINLSEVMEQLQQRPAHRFLEQMLNEDMYLLENKFTSWLEGRFNSFLTTINRVLVAGGGLSLQLRYFKQGAAHTIDVNSGDNVKFSIKFVPFFLFEATKWVETRHMTSRYWEAIPKPISGVSKNPSFRTSCMGSENAIFASIHPCRHLLRLMIKFRNSRPDMKNLKSYHLKSIFLWVHDEMGSSFWSQSNVDVLRMLFERLRVALETKEIKSFWNPELNYLREMAVSKIERMWVEVKAALHVLTPPIVNLLRVFLTTNEQLKFGVDVSRETLEVDKIFQTLSNFINIDQDREIYTKMYDFVRTAVITGLKRDKHFKLLFAGYKLAGSYADNLKISKPNEFDLVMRLRLPHDELVEISPDNENRGNVFLNLSRVQERLLKENESVHTFLKKMLNEKHFLLEDKIQSWLQGLVSGYVASINGKFTYDDGSTLLIAYSKQGPAHTINVQGGDEYEFSIDFVPGFQFDAEKLTSKRLATQAGDVWEAIPKPMFIKNNPSFRTSSADSERIIFQNLYQFKNVLRLMKKFRDTRNLVHLKSYFIKTLFLWHNEKCDQSFWRQPTVDILKVMFDELEGALERQEIKFFWDDGLNMLGQFTNDQIKSMYLEVRAANKTLHCAVSLKHILRVFLTEDELVQMQQNSQLKIS